ASWGRGGRVEDPPLEMMGPSPDRRVLRTGHLLIELVNPLQESADRARIHLKRGLADLAEQAMSLASEGQERRSERRVFGVEEGVRGAPKPARDTSPD